MKVKKTGKRTQQFTETVRESSWHQCMRNWIIKSVIIKEKAEQGIVNDYGLPLSCTLMH